MTRSALPGRQRLVTGQLVVDAQALVFWALLLLTLLHGPGAAAASRGLLQEGEVAVNDSGTFLAALRDPSVGRVVLSEEDIVLDPAEWTQQKAVLLEEGRHVTITALGAPNLTAPAGPDLANATFLDFNDLWPVVTVGSGASLTLQNLVLRDTKDAHALAPDELQPGSTRVVGLVLWPSINAEAGAEIVLDNALYSYHFSDCTPEGIRARATALWSVAGNWTWGLMPDNRTSYVNGRLELPLEVSPVQGGPPKGDMRLVVKGAAVTCMPEGPGALPAAGAVLGNNSSSSSSGGSGSGDSGPGWWVWLLVGLGAAVAVAATSVSLGFWLARRTGAGSRAQGPDANAPTAAAAGTAVDGSEQGQLADIKVDGPSVALPLVAPAAPSTPQGSSSQRYSGLGSTMRVRFGNLEQVELGELIGKGGYGRVYRARWRGAPVAVKVVEHSAASTPGQEGASAGSPSGSTTAFPRESLLSTVLSHPNIVATYRVNTVQLQPGPVLPQQDSGRSSFGRGHDTSPTPAAVAAGGEEVAGPGGGGEGTVPPPGAVEGGQAAKGGRGSPRSAAAGAGSLEEAPTWSGAGSSSMGAAAAAGGSSGSRSGSSRAFYETWMVLEYCDKGSLADAIRARRFLSRRTGQPHLTAVLVCLQDVARGLLYLHSNSIVHGDLKAGNVLLKSREDGGKGFTCKLADFGLSRLLSPDQTQLLTQALGTIGYMPPEVMTHGQLSFATDVYSYGLLMYELVAGQFAFARESAAQIFFSVVHKGERPALPEEVKVPSEYVDLMQRCWVAEPEARPQCSELLREIGALVARYAS